MSVAALSATPVTYDYSFGGVSGGGITLGTSHKFTPAGYTAPIITAYGFSGLGDGHGVTATDLYSKGAAFDFSNPSDPNNGESGLGIASGSDHEIAGSDFVVLDISKLNGLVLSSINLYFESTTGDDKFALWGSNVFPSGTVSEPGNGVITGDQNGAVNIAALAGDKYLYITADCGNILVGGIAATDPASTPEPAYTGALGGMLIFGGAFLRRRLSRRKV